MSMIMLNNPLLVGVEKSVQSITDTKWCHWPLSTFRYVPMDWEGSKI